MHRVSVFLYRLSHKPRSPEWLLQMHFCFSFPDHCNENLRSVFGQHTILLGVCWRKEYYRTTNDLYFML
jgi:hypothetical protein